MKANYRHYTYVPYHLLNSSIVGNQRWFSSYLSIPMYNILIIDIDYFWKNLKNHDTGLPTEDRSSMTTYTFFHSVNLKEDDIFKISCVMMNQIIKQIVLQIKFLQVKWIWVHCTIAVFYNHVYCSLSVVFLYNSYTNKPKKQ